MMHLAAVITSLAARQPLAIAAIFCGLFFEGEIIIFTAMFLTHRGVFNIYEIAPVIVAAVLLNDLFWHKLGGSAHGRSERALRLTGKISGPLDALLKNHPFKTFFITKFTYGLMRPTLVRSGMLDMPTKDFIKYDYPAAAIWIALVGGLGYFSSASLPLLKHYLKLGEVVLAIFLAALFVLWHLVIKYYLKEQTDADN